MCRCYTAANLMDRLDSSSLCTQGCGFFGSSSFDGMCSKCFKDNLKRKSAQQNSEHGVASATPVAQPEPVKEVIKEPEPEPVPEQKSIAIPKANDDLQSGSPLLGGSPSSALSTTPEGDKGKSPSKGKNRCFTCHKKIGLTGFKCRCENSFCGLHRYSDKHECPFDYKSDGRAKLEKDNPQVVGAKIRKI